MKCILAIIRINKMNQTKRALADAGIYSLTVRNVLGRGKGAVDSLLLKGAAEGHEEAINQLGPGPKFMPKRMLILVVPDSLVDPAVETIIKVNQTGSPGDGKVFVMPELDAYRIRTGENGDMVLDEELAV